MPGHVDDAAQVLRTAASAVPVDTMADTEQQLGAIASRVATAGAAMGESLASRCRALADEARTFAGRLASMREALRAAADQMAAEHGPSTPGAPNSSPSSAPRPTPRRTRPATAVQHQDGSRYPVEASWAVPTLPRRVGLDGQTTTVGRIKIGNTELPGEFRSGEWDRWADAARQRMIEINPRIPRHLQYHVEMRTVAMMIDSKQNEASVCINNVPCGYVTRPVGCHQVLDDVLPPGYRLTVYGTDRNGKPFSRTYGRGSGGRP